MEKDFNVNSICESTENIKLNPNCVDSQINNFKQIYDQKQVSELKLHSMLLFIIFFLLS